LIGPSISHYRITAKLGQGGMGEVYRATDTKLDREVAIKVLPESFARDKERLARFEREAKALAALNHPNIAAIHGLERAGNSQALILELVEGEDLSERLKRGPLPVEEALDLCKQIAEALEAAHEKGIIHRDLKPGNVKLTADGKVKVLDFGLAKVGLGVPAEPKSGAVGTPRSTLIDSQSPTITADCTMPGTLLGTAGYMSPEQARGEPVDKRSDIWSFGVVLFECLTGKRLFPGETATDSIGALLHKEIDWSQLPPNTPPTILLLLRKCLVRDRKRRLQDIGDARVDLEQAIADPSSSFIRLGEGALRETRTRRGMPLTLVVGLVLAVALIAAALGWFLKPTSSREPNPVARLALTLPPGQVLRDDFTDFDVSANSQFVYISAGRLYLRDLDDPKPRPLFGVTGATAPCFSPDGQWVAFVANGQLMRIATVGGVPQRLCDFGGEGTGLSWGPDDTVYFASANMSGISKVAASSDGDVEPVTKLDPAAGEISHRSPQVLPGGKAILFTVWTGPGWAEKRVELQILATGERRVVADGGVTGRYVSSGHVVYSLEGDQTLMARPFDLETLSPTGPAVPLDEAVASGTESALYAVSPSGVLAYVAANPGRYRNQMAWIDRDGAVERFGPEGPYYGGVQLSPTGRFAAVTSGGPVAKISIYDFSTGLLNDLQGDESNQFPKWHPNGMEIIYRGTRSGSRNLYGRAADGSGVEHRLTTSANLQTACSVSSNGWLLFTEIDPATSCSIWKMQVDNGDREPQAFIRSQEWEDTPQFSPDGRFVAYSTGLESGSFQVFVVPFPRAEPRRLVGAGLMPVWSRDGSELFFLGPNGNQLRVADVSGDGSDAEVRNARVLASNWQGKFLGSGPGYYDVSSGGRFLAIVPVQPSPVINEITVVLNWLEELKQRVPTEE